MSIESLATEIVHLVHEKDLRDNERLAKENRVSDNLGKLGISTKELLQMANRLKELADSKMSPPAHRHAVSEALSLYNQAVAAFDLSPELIHEESHFKSRILCNISLCKDKLEDKLGALEAAKKAILADRTNYSGYLRAAKSLLDLEHVISTKEVLVFLERKIPQDRRLQELQQIYQKKRKALSMSTDYTRFDEMDIPTETSQNLPDMDAASFEGLPDPQFQGILDLLEGKPSTNEGQSAPKPSPLRLSPPKSITSIPPILVQVVSRWAESHLVQTCRDDFVWIGRHPDVQNHLRMSLDSFMSSQQETKSCYLSAPYPVTPWASQLLESHRTRLCHEQVSEEVTNLILEPLKFTSTGGLLPGTLDEEIVSRKAKVWPSVLEWWFVPFEEKMPSEYDGRAKEDYYDHLMERVNWTERQINRHQEYRQSECGQIRAQAARAIASFNFNTQQLERLGDVFDPEDSDPNTSYVSFIVLKDHRDVPIASNACSDIPGLTGSLLILSKIRYHRPLLHSRRPKYSEIQYDITKGFSFEEDQPDPLTKLCPLLIPKQLEFVKNRSVVDFFRFSFISLVESLPKDELARMNVVSDLGFPEFDALLLMDGLCRGHALTRPTNSSALTYETPRGPCLSIARSSGDLTNFRKNVLAFSDHVWVRDLSHSLRVLIHKRRERDERWTTLSGLKKTDRDYIDKDDIATASRSLVQTVDVENQVNASYKPFSLYSGFGVDLVKSSKMYVLSPSWHQCVGIVENGMLHSLSELKTRFPNPSQFPKFIGSESDPKFQIYAVGVTLNSHGVSDEDVASFDWGVYDNQLGFQRVVRYDDQDVWTQATEPVEILNTPLSSVSEANLLVADLPLLDSSYVVDAILVWTETTYVNETRTLRLTNRPISLISGESSSSDGRDEHRQEQQLLLRPMLPNSAMTDRASFRWGIPKMGNSDKESRRCVEFILDLSNAGFKAFGSPECVHTTRRYPQISDLEVQSQQAIHNFSDKVIQRFLTVPEECQQALDLLLHDAEFQPSLKLVHRELARHLVSLRL